MKLKKLTLIITLVVVLILAIPLTVVNASSNHDFQDTGYGELIFGDYSNPITYEKIETVRTSTLSTLNLRIKSL